jgi:hypothetical protein
MSLFRGLLLPTIACLIAPAGAFAQTPFSSAASQDQHQHAPQASAWLVMQDGVVFLTFNRQGSPRGDSELVSQNWWMGMASRPGGPGRLTLMAMLSLDPLTVGAEGYSEIFQAGEVHDGRPIIDRQHPHDFLMQLAAVWRVPLDSRTGLTLAGAPVGEPALGPIAFMHRASAVENPTAPLGHHTFDSTHIAMGVLTAAVDRGPWLAETSLFHGREPDADRWDLMDPGPLDSWSARVWYTPSPSWRFQMSHGFLNEPEELEAGDVRRTTVSAAWRGEVGRYAVAATAAYGRNDKRQSDFNAWLGEATVRWGPYAAYSRFEAVQVETDLLRFGSHSFKDHHGTDAPAPARVLALTLGGVRDLRSIRGFDLGLGGDLTFYGVPSPLEPYYRSRPVSAHVFLRLRPPAPMGRMIDAIMTRPAM